MRDWRFLADVTHLRFKVPLQSSSEFISSDETHIRCLSELGHKEYLTMTIDLGSGEVVPHLKDAALQVYCKEQGTYYFLKGTHELARLKGIYVLDCLQVDDNSYGDAILMTIKDGFVENWPSLSLKHLQNELESSVSLDSVEYIDTTLGEMDAFLREQGKIIVDLGKVSRAVEKVYDEFQYTYDPDHDDAEGVLNALRNIEDMLGLKL